MAKRKRLGPAFADDAAFGPDPLTAPDGRAPAPIAQVSGDAALQAALHEVSDELRQARVEGRMVARLPLDAVDEGHLVRDRIAMDAEDLATLTDSLRARGQQTPIEVVDLGGGRYGLISGWRRLTALRRLYEGTGDARFSQVQALIRQPEGAAGAYLAMVEENEIRAALSFYERARIAVQAVAQGVHEDVFQAVQGLFASARPPKRSKIMAFSALIEPLDAHLRFPAAIPEKLGLALAGALKADVAFRRGLIEALNNASPETPEAERRVLERALVTPKAKGSARREVAAGVTLETGRGRLVLSGAGVTPELIADLERWLAAR
jgi:hypothetical protein